MTDEKEIVEVGTGVIVNDADLSALGLSELADENESDDYPILSLGDVVPVGEEAQPNTVYAGQTIVGELVGTVPMWSLEPKENWKEEEAEGRKYFTSLHYKFINPKTGETFGLFSSSTLFNLQKIATSATDPMLKNPLVGIKYLGKIVGKDRLKEEFNIEIKKGDSAHVCKLLLSKDTPIDTFAAGCVNYTRNPLPNFGSKVKMSKIEQAKANFAAQENRKAMREAGNTQAQLA